MYCSELDSFILKFKHLWHSGVNAHLDVRTHAGNAWVSLHVQLGHAPGPLHHQLYPTSAPSSRSKNSPSRQRRRARREAARKEKAEEAVKITATNENVSEAENAKENVSHFVGVAEEASTAEETSTSEEASTAEEASTVVEKHVSDELCPDDVYASSEVSESIGETSFRCYQCRMLFIPSSHVDGQNIVDYDSCQKHIGVLKCVKCSLVLVGLAKIGCHRGVCHGSA